jgi:hypothetical protein
LIGTTNAAIENYNSQSRMNCSIAQNLKLDYQKACAREQEAKEADRRAVTQMQQEIARTQVEHRTEERKKAAQHLAEHYNQHGCGEASKSVSERRDSARWSCPVQLTK